MKTRTGSLSAAYYEVDLDHNPSYRCLPKIHTYGTKFDNEVFFDNSRFVNFCHILQINVTPPC
jgi:hypothetical protein